MRVILIAPVQPGQTLIAELAARGLSIETAATALGVPAQHFGCIAKGYCRIDAEMAIRLGFYFGTGPEFWMNLQANFDLGTAIQMHSARIEREVTPAPAP